MQALAAGVLHDLNQSLSLVIGFLDLARGLVALLMTAPDSEASELGGCGRHAEEIGTSRLLPTAGRFRYRALPWPGE